MMQGHVCGSNTYDFSGHVRQRQRDWRLCLDMQWPFSILQKSSALLGHVHTPHFSSCSWLQCRGPFSQQQTSGSPWSPRGQSGEGCGSQPRRSNARSDWLIHFPVFTLTLVNQPGPCESGIPPSNLNPVNN